MEEIKHNELISKKHKKVCMTLNYVEYLLILASVVTGCLFISAFASLAGVPAGIVSSAATIKICVATAGIKNYKSIFKKKQNRKKHNKIVLLGYKLVTIEALISKSLICTYIIHDEFVSINNVLREYNEAKEEMKSPENSVEYTNKYAWYKQKNLWKKLYKNNTR